MAPRQKYVEIPDLETPSREPSPVFSSDEEDGPLFFVYIPIEDPVSTFIGEHANRSQVRFFVRYETMEQDESVFYNVPESCTVQELIDRLNLRLPPSARVRVYVIINSLEGASYVVEVIGNNREHNVIRNPIVSPRNFDTDSPESPDNSYDRGLAEEMPTSSENPSTETVEASTSTNYPSEEILRPAPTLASNWTKYSPTCPSPLHEPRVPVLTDYERGFSPTSAQFSPPQMSHSSSSPSFWLRNTSPSYSPPPSPASSRYTPEYCPESLNYFPSSPSSSTYTPTLPRGSPTSSVCSPPLSVHSPTSRMSPEYSPTLPEYSGSHNSGVFPISVQVSSSESLTSPQLSFNDLPRYSPTSPCNPSSYELRYSPTSPCIPSSYELRYSPEYCPDSPNYSPSSPVYIPSSPTYSPTSPVYIPSSPTYKPTSPEYIPSSPTYSPTSPEYIPSSPTYSPTSPEYIPSSPTYSPTSPKYLPVSPEYLPIYNSEYSPTSPEYSLSYGPRYSPTLPDYSPVTPSYIPTSISYMPTPLSYSPASPDNPNDRGVDPAMFYRPTTPNYRPTFQSLKPESPDNSFDSRTAFIKQEIVEFCRPEVKTEIKSEYDPLIQVKKEVVEFYRPEVKTEIKSESDMLTEDDTLDANSPF